MARKLMTDTEVAEWFGHRAAGLYQETCDELARVGLVPVCVTSSFARVTGRRLDRRGRRLDLPVFSRAANLPPAIRQKVSFSPRHEGEEMVIFGELGGITNSSEYVLVRLVDFEVGESLVRVSCRGTRHAFTRYAGGWAYVRTEAEAVK